MSSEISNLGASGSAEPPASAAVEESNEWLLPFVTVL